MGDQLLMMGHRREAADHFSRAQQLLLALSGLSTSRASLFALHDSYYRVLFVHIADGDLAQAKLTAERAIAIAEKLAAADADDTQARLVLAADYANLGEVLSLSGRQAEAQAAVARGLRIDDEFVRRYPNTTQFRAIRFHRLLIGGRSYYLSGNDAAALQYYRDARDLLQGVATQDPKNLGSRLRLGIAYSGIGSVLLRRRDLDAASQAYQDALAALAKTLESESPSEDAIYTAAGAHAALGEIELARAASAGTRTERLSRLQRAREWTERSLALWQRIKEPGLASPGGYPSTPLAEVQALHARIRTAIDNS